VRRVTAGRQGGQLLLAAGVFTLVNNYLPGSEHLELPVLNAVGVLAVLIGAGCLVVPWDRLPVRAPLVVLVVALVMLPTGSLYGNVSPYSYAVYYVVVFVWVGIAQPPRTSFWVAPLAVVAYLAPFLLDEAPPASIASVTVAIPVCVLVGEVLARQVARLEQSRSAAVRRGEHEQAVVDALADGVLVVGADGRVLSCNDAATALLGVPRTALVGAPPPIELGAPGDLLHSTVGARWLETVATTIDGTGEHVVVLRDISRHRALDQAKDLFLATTSHELRTPLTAIKGYVHVLQHRWDALDEDRRRAALATVAERTDALVALTEHLLLGARAGASRHSTDTRPFDLSEALTSAVQAYDGSSPRHRIVVELPDVPLRAVGDPAGLQHVVGQLVENAVKYSPGGGTVRVCARAEGGSAVVEVADEGVGIPAGDGVDLFAPFSQAGATNTREYGGVGLGLYIVRQLVEAQGGTVAAANRPGGGAVVSFTLPLTTAPLVVDGAAVA
jgi:signal transduction histidine kinase